MSKLTEKQEKFCHAYIETGSQTAAYRAAGYDCSKMKPESVNRLAKGVYDNVKIQSRLAELRAPVIEKLGITLESHLERLRVLSEKAEAKEQYSAAIKAEENRGKVSGLYTDKVDVSNKDGSMRPTVIKFVRPGEEDGDQ